MFNQEKGKCRCCREETELSVICNNSFICLSCSDKIEKSLLHHQTAECRICSRVKSLLALEGSESAGFICWSCQPEGTCAFCGHKNSLPLAGSSRHDGLFVFCRDCRIQIPQADEKYEFVN